MVKKVNPGGSTRGETILKNVASEQPIAAELAQAFGYAEPLRSKSWDEFARADSPAIDIVITVCDNAAGELRPIWPGQPVTAHWGVPDPVAADRSGEDRRRAFQRAWMMLRRRIDLLLAPGIAYGLSRWLNVPHCVAGPAALIGASNFLELAVAAAISLFGLRSGAALATVVGVLVEVPVMLSMVRIVNRTGHWFGERAG